MTTLAPNKKRAVRSVRRAAPPLISSGVGRFPTSGKTNLLGLLLAAFTGHQLILITMTIIIIILIIMILIMITITIILVVILYHIKC